MPGDWILLPVRPFDDGKRRLATVLSPIERAALNARFFRHVLGIACGVVGAARCVVVSRSPAVLDEAAAAGAVRVAETGDALNAALLLAADAATMRGATRLLALSCDLPFLAEADLIAMLDEAADVTIAPDAAGAGTNALLFRAAAPISYRFGPGSCAAHVEEATVRGLGVATVRRPGLARDIDLPADLALLGR